MNTHRGLFQYNRLPFGVSAAPVVFQRCTENLLRGCQGVCVYLDDILIAGSTIEQHLQHLQHLERVLQTLETARLRLNKSKCAFLLPKIEYLGHIIDESGLHRIHRKKSKLYKKHPNPKTLQNYDPFLE